jgi:hypothetical protein
VQQDRESKGSSANCSSPAQDSGEYANNEYEHGTGNDCDSVKSANGDIGRQDVTQLPYTMGHRSSRLHHAGEEQGASTTRFWRIVQSRRAQRSRGLGCIQIAGEDAAARRKKDHGKGSGIGYAKPDASANAATSSSEVGHSLDCTTDEGLEDAERGRLDDGNDDSKRVADDTHKDSVMSMDAGQSEACPGEKDKAATPSSTATGESISDGNELHTGTECDRPSQDSDAGRVDCSPAEPPRQSRSDDHVHPGIDILELGYYEVLPLFTNKFPRPARPVSRHRCVKSERIPSTENAAQTEPSSPPESPPCPGFKVCEPISTAVGSEVAERASYEAISPKTSTDVPNGTDKNEASLTPTDPNTVLGPSAQRKDTAFSATNASSTDIAAPSVLDTVRQLHHQLRELKDSMNESSGTAARTSDPLPRASSSSVDSTEEINGGLDSAFGGSSCKSALSRSSSIELDENIMVARPEFCLFLDKLGEEDGLERLYSHILNACRSSSDKDGKSQEWWIPPTAFLQTCRTVLDHFEPMFMDVMKASGQQRQLVTFDLSSADDKRQYRLWLAGCAGGYLRHVHQSLTEQQDSADSRKKPPRMLNSSFFLQDDKTFALNIECMCGGNPDTCAVKAFTMQWLHGSGGISLTHALGFYQYSKSSQALVDLAIDYAEQINVLEFPVQGRTLVDTRLPDKGRGISIAHSGLFEGPHSSGWMVEGKVRETKVEAYGRCFGADK